MDGSDPIIQLNILTSWYAYSLELRQIGNIDWDNAVSVGSQHHIDMTGQNFEDLKLERNGRVRPLSAMGSTIKVRNELLVVNEQHTLNRMLAFRQTSNDLRQYVQYEFNPFPL